MALQRFDAYAAARIDRQYASPAIVEQRRRTLDALALAAGESALDVGCGPGYLAAEMGAAVGPGGKVFAIDNSAPMLEIARRRCAELTWVEIHEGDALHLPLADAAVDAAAVVQLLLLVAEPERYVAEVARVLRPGGRIVVVDTDWDSIVWHSSAPARMQRFLAQWTRRYVNANVARLMPGLLRDAGLTLELTHAIPIVELAAGDDTYSGSQLKEIPGYVTGKDGITESEARAWLEDQNVLQAAGRYFYSLNRFLFLARKPLS
jgi:ubiquinone/menaquinone biosynthesis C-methylase UbiE